jgi:hypothetical protein
MARTSETAAPANEGEGNKTAAREFNAAQQRFARNGQVKEKAREAMKKAGVPMLPGSDGIIASPEEAVEWARTIGLPALGFLIAYSRMPQSLDDAARLVPISPVRRAWRLVLPLVVPSLAATAGLKIVASGALAGSLLSDPSPVTVVLTTGRMRYCLTFAVPKTFKPGIKYVALDAPAAAACPP